MKRFSPGLIALLIFPAAVLAQAAVNPKATVVDLKFTIVDLVSNTGTIRGETKDLEVKETATEIRIEMAADVLFEFDKAVLLPKAEQTLKQAAAVIGEKAAGNTVRIDGHTDSKGDDTYNQKLSERRANAVKNWFVDKGGLTSVVFKTQGLGERQPVAPNAKTDGSDDPDGRQKNRRVEIIVKKG